MKNFAVINNNIVENLIVSESKEIAETVTKKTCIEYDENVSVNIGWKYENNNFIDTTPPINENDFPFVQNDN